MPAKNQGSLHVIVPNPVAWQNALKAAKGDERRLLTIDENTVMTYNSEEARNAALRQLRRGRK